MQTAKPVLHDKCVHERE